MLRLAPAIGVEIKHRFVVSLATRCQMALYFDFGRLLCSIANGTC